MVVVNIGSYRSQAAPSPRLASGLIDGSERVKQNEALDALVPGDYPQVESDLGQFPESMLGLMDRYGIRVAVLEKGETLQDSPALRTLSPDEYAVERQAANSLVHQSLVDAQISDPYDFADGVTRELRGQRLDFHLGLAGKPFSLNELAERRGIPAQNHQDWTASFKELNKGLVSIEADVASPTAGLVILPHAYSNDKAIPESRLSNSKYVTADFVEKSLGLNRAEDRLVLLHKKFTGSPAIELGNYRLAIHEVGHALDYTLDALTGFPGFGAIHRQTMDEMFEADKSRAEKTSPEEVFTSDRADDNVREYFAEAVEAYLTFPTGGEHDTFRTGNSRPGLKAKNPALYKYMEHLFSTDFSEAQAPEPPVKGLIDKGYPDPDLAVLRIS